MRCSSSTAAVMAAVFVITGSASLESRALDLSRAGERQAQLQLAQVDVVESSPTIRGIGQQRNSDRSQSEDSGQVAAPSVQSELYYQLQVLQEEVQALRGQVEEQAHELRRLKQQRMDDYVDLDRRISQLSEAAPRDSSQGGDNSSAGEPRVATGTGGDSSSGEFASYSAAVDLATKEQAFDRAIAALEEHLEQYPDGQYAANAHYWLGQIYFVQSNLEEAQQAFARVVDDHPDHNKVPEARYKLGQVYFRLGDEAQAKTLLEEVASGDSDSAALAKNFLRQNYP